MCKSLIPNFTPLLPPIWKILAGIHLRPGVKFRFHCADFNKNHSRFINVVEILYTELHSNRSRNMESTSRNTFTPLRSMADKKPIFTKLQLAQQFFL
jgi:hypothetical protein